MLTNDPSLIDAHWCRFRPDRLAGAQPLQPLRLLLVRRC